MSNRRPSRCVTKPDPFFRSVLILFLHTPGHPGDFFAYTNV